MKSADCRIELTLHPLGVYVETKASRSLGVKWCAGYRSLDGCDHVTPPLLSFCRKEQIPRDKNVSSRSGGSYSPSGSAEHTADGFHLFRHPPESNPLLCGSSGR